MQSLGSRVLTGGGVQVAVRVAGLATSAVTVPVLARHLGTAGYGQFTIALSLAWVVIVVTDLGLPLLISRDWPRIEADARDGWLDEVWSVRWGTAAALTVLAVAGMLVSSFDNKTVLVLGLLMVPVVVVHNGVSAVFTAELDPWPVARGDLVTRFLWVVLLVAAVGLGASLPLIMIAVVVAHFGGLLATAIPGARRGFIKRPAPMRRPQALLRAAAPLALIPLLGAVYARADTLVFALRATEAEVGVYGAMWRITEAMLAIVVVGGALLLPRMSGAPDRRRRRSDYIRTFRLLMTVYLPGAVFVAALASPIMRLVGGNEFATPIQVPGGEVSPALALGIMMLVMVLMVFGIINGSMMVACDRQRALLRQLILVLATNLALVWWLAPWWSVVGVAVASVCSELVGLLHAWPIVRQELGRMELWRTLAWPVVIATAVGMAMWVGSGSSPVMMGAIGVGVAAGMGWFSPARRDLSTILSQEEPIDLPSGEVVG